MADKLELPISVPGMSSCPKYFEEGKIMNR
jgi:hypothetical protein